MSQETLVTFIRNHTRLDSPSYLPEIKLHLADEAFDLWEATERQMGTTHLAPPFWAFAWPGGMALARYVLDHPDLVAGRRVLDLAAGSGVVAIAAAMAGAKEVTASEIDPLAVTAITLNATANGVSVRTVLGDILDGDGEDAQVVLAGDVFYEKLMAERVMAFLERVTRRGAQVMVGDPGRTYLPRTRFQQAAVQQVPVNRALEDADVKTTTVWRLPVTVSPDRTD